MQKSVRLTLRLVLVCGLASGSGSAQPGATDGDWRTYAGDTWASKYSPLDQINADNFGDLEIAWRWKTADTHLVVADDSGASLVRALTKAPRFRPAEAIEGWPTGKATATPASSGEPAPGT